MHVATLPEAASTHRVIWAFVWSALVAIFGSFRLFLRIRLSKLSLLSLDSGPRKSREREDGRMVDDGRTKRLESSEDGVVSAAELESEIQQPRSEIARLRQPGRRQEEVGHEVLPAVVEVVVTATTKVDLSGIDTGLVTHISSFLGTPHELLNLALTCKTFGWRLPTSHQTWSLVEEIARQILSSRATDFDVSSLPRNVSGATTWLSILHMHEHPLVFDVLLGGYIAHRNGEKTAVCATGTRDEEHFNNNAAVSSNCIMRSGTHYAEFQIKGEPFIGIVRPMPDLDANAYDGDDMDFSFNGVPLLTSDFHAQRSDDWGDSNVHACDYCCYSGEMSWTNWDRESGEGIDWEGMERCRTGDTVGMLLNLNEGTLTVYKNNHRLGVMKDGLSGPYCWYAGVAYYDEITIKRGAPPVVNDM